MKRQQALVWQRCRWFCRAAGERVHLEVSLNEIKARNWNLDCKNTHVGEQVSHDPDELLRNYAALQGEIGELRDQLKAMLNEALTRA